MDEPDPTTEIPTRTLVESMIREDATIDAGELYDVAAALGMSDQQVRLCIKRLVAEGRFTHEGRGRTAVLRATGDTRGAIEPELEYLRFMYAQDRGRARWDGVWHLAAFAVPESQRHARDSIRDTLVYLGGAAIQGGLYVSANPWEDRIGAAAAELGIESHLTTLTTTDLAVGGLTEGRAIAARLWPLDRLAAGHERLLGVAQRVRAALPAEDPTELLTLAITLAAEFDRAVGPDPLLPPELLPQPWIGARARAAVAECWALLRDSALPPIRLFRWYGEVVAEITAAT
ncbi:repressor [Nocardia seriolae]|uniref:Repressor n=2 Tax=Nocardia seriolae TaxID=37332 RepID=A0ABC9Z2E5_9NOCA|nr:repressor [Nocardia seriolae]BEK89254.1 transcriptional regulator [Nocardia seriolae]BEK95121.1 transcriptional regulator [Nocardia seriolae]GAM49753.1 repressor [Nocardia seriolae]GAP31683.1 repressor [Nocardia seriolae]